MTDLEFYQKALVYQSYLANRIAEIKAYGSDWGDGFCVDEIKKTSIKFYSNEEIKNLFSIDNLTVERAKALRFSQWSDDNPDLYLFPLWFVFFVPYGTKVISIGGEEFEYTENTDLDTRFGCVAFGIEIKQ